MPPLKVLLALITHDNDYQRAQAASAESTARRHGVELETLYAENDAVLQIEQILTAIQRRDHGISLVIVQPVGTGMLHVAEEAAKNGVAWAALNRELDYTSRLRSAYNVPVYEVSLDQLEIGRI
jgi:ABC-type sugar transport system substrate-binding protein